MKLKEETEAAQASLAEAKKAATMERNTLSSLKARFHKAQRSLFRDDPLKKATVTAPSESHAALLPEVLAVLEDAVDGFVSLVEGEARLISSSALTCVFSHLYLRDASFDLATLLEPVDPDSCNAPADTVKGSVEALLVKFSSSLAPRLEPRAREMVTSSMKGLHRRAMATTISEEVTWQ